MLRVALILIAVLSALALPAEAGGRQPPALAPCQLAGHANPHVQAGFPLTPHRVPGVGVANIAMIFVDFSDAAATAPTTALFDTHWPHSEEYFETSSYGRLDVTITPVHQWLRMSKPSGDYRTGTIEGYFAYWAEAIALADSVADLSGTDTVLVMVEPSAHSIGTLAWVTIYPEWAFVVEGGQHVIYNAVNRAGALSGAPTAEYGQDASVVVHEILHNMGLPDLYHRGVGGSPFVGNFDPMGSNYGYQGGTFGGSHSYFNAKELLAWQRWQLGWIDDAQVDCMTGAAITSSLTSLTDAGGTKAAIVALDTTRVLVAEARSPRGYDADLERSGVLVYTVQPSIPTGEGPIRVQGDYGGDWPDGSVLVQPGQALTVAGYTVHVISADAQGGFDIEMYESLCDGKAATIDMNLNGGNGLGTVAGDVILGTGGSDRINGLGGDDTICAGAGPDDVRGGPGDDVIFGEGAGDELRGGGGGDVIDGGAGGDSIGGQGGTDTIIGGGGDDNIDGQGAADTIIGGGGDDTISGQNGADVMTGGDGVDTIKGQTGPDTLHGDGQNDTLTGGNGNDTLYGGPGFDKCSGNLGPNDQAEAATCEQTPGVETLF